MGIVSLPATVHVEPSADQYAVMTWPARVSFTHAGAVPLAAAPLVEAPPAVTRRWKTIPLPGLTSMNACGEPALSVSRIMTPAFVHASTFCTDATRATIVP